MLPLVVCKPLQHGEQNVIMFLRRTFLMLGLSDKQIPDDKPSGGLEYSELDVLVEYILKFYWNIALDKIEQAFTLYTQDELVDYGAPKFCSVFSCNFFSKVMKSYFLWMKANGIVTLSSEAERWAKAPADAKQLEYKPVPVDWSEFLKKQHFNISTIPLECYNYLVQKKGIAEDAYKDFLEPSLNMHKAYAASKARTHRQSSGKWIKFRKRMLLS